MNRYRKANEGIHAPDEVKENAVRPAQKRTYPRWKGAVAAVLAVAIISGASAWSIRAGGPNPDESTPAGYGLRTAGGPASGKAMSLAAAQYPEMHPFPKDEDFFTDGVSWEKAQNAKYKAEAAWRKDMDALRTGTDYAGLLDGFLTRSTAQFLTDTGEENRVYSPLNVYLALSMLAETTGGNTRSQILDLLQADSVEALRARAASLWRDNYRDDGTVTSILANSLWLRNGMTYSQKTLDTLAKDYYASSFSGEMGSEEYNQALRDWLNEQTGGLLEEQAGQLELNPATVLALASTVYFKAAWGNEFYEPFNERKMFHAPGGDVECEFMYQDPERNFYWGDHFTAAAMDFQQGGKMWFLLPDEGTGVDELLNSGEAMEFLLADKQTYDEKTETYTGWPNQKSLKVNLSLPKFDVSSDLDLIEGLQKLGVTDVFKPGAANFDPLEASADGPLYVSRVQHAARVTVDEQGCEAAAYTIIDVLCGGGFIIPDDEVDFTLDRPFLFAITGDSGLPLFVGIVNQPNG